ncbi:MAG: potassium transporter TrkG [Neisseria sp.]|nr:potassium transporter TrkG [Neisseria sp.]
MYKLLPTLHVFAQLSCLFALLLLAPVPISYLYMDDLALTHVLSAVLTFAFSFALWAVTRPYQRELQARDGFTLVVLLWLGFALLAAVPFYLSIPNMRFIDAYFEAISGLTTTGATVISSLDTLAPSLNFWRHMLNWLGGMGIIVLAVAILPLLGVGGMQLFRAEVSGINKGRKLAPRITQTAKNMWAIYILFTLLILLGLKWAGMSWFDALCHAMSSVSLGGFSTHDSSVAYFNSVPIELVLSLGMLLGGISFTNHFAAFQNRSLKTYWRDLEVRASFYVLFGSIIAVSFYLWVKDFYGFGEALRYVSFSFISIGLASGFTNTDFGQWPLTASLWMFLLANVVANSGSTGGGIKMIRVLVLFKFMLREMTLLLHPNAVRTVKINNFTVPERTALTVLAFIFVYFMSVVLFTFVLMISGFDFVSALSTIVTCITNAGPGLGMSGPSGNWSLFSDGQKSICAFVMLLGRLEIFTVFILFTPAYWRK